MSRDAVAESITVTANAPATDRAKSFGVTIEAKYTVGEYDILILSAKQSSGLEMWLTENGYTLPKGAAYVLGSYIRQNMHFFVAKVNLGEQARLGFNYLRPLQVAYESPKFMLPIRLGTVNANGAQELFVYAITTRGRVETTNYKTVKLPSDVDIPLFVRQDFSPFYKALFTEQVKRKTERRLSRIRVEHELVRSVRVRAAVAGRAAQARRLLARCGQQRLPHAAACPLRPRALPRGSRVSGDGG